MNQQHDEFPELAPGAVIAAMDLSDRSAEVLAQAHGWATRLSAPLALCHVEPSYDAIMPLMPHNYRPVIDRGHQDAVIERLGDLASSLGIEDYDICLLSGSAHAAIIELVVASPPRLLVIGATQKSTIEHLLLGGTAAQLIRHAPCPVLVARASPSDGPIFAATDLSDPALQAVRAAADEAKRRGAQLMVVHALDLPRQLALAAIEPSAGLDAKTAATFKDAAERVIAGMLDGLGIDGHGVVVEGRTARAISDVAEDLCASLIVVASHGHTRLERIALGSSADAIVRAAPCSVLVQKLGPATAF